MLAFRPHGRRVDIQLGDAVVAVPSPFGRPVQPDALEVELHKDEGMPANKGQQSAQGSVRKGGKKLVPIRERNLRSRRQSSVCVIRDVNHERSVSSD
jgi:hypothetical protein